MNDLDLCVEIVSRSCQPMRYILRISETVRDRGLVPKDHHWKWSIRGNQMVTWPMTTSRDPEWSNSWPQYA